MNRILPPSCTVFARPRGGLKHQIIGLTPSWRVALVWLAAVFCIGSGVAQAALSE